MVDLAAVLGEAVISALWIVLMIVDTGRPHARRRSYWFAMLIGARSLS